MFYTIVCSKKRQLSTVVDIFPSLPHIPTFPATDVCRVARRRVKQLPLFVLQLPLNSSRESQKYRKCVCVIYNPKSLRELMKPKPESLRDISKITHLYGGGGDVVV